MDQAGLRAVHESTVAMDRIVVYLRDRSGGIIQQRQQQVLDRDELMALLPSLDKGHVQADFKFLRNHSVSSITH